MILLAQQKKILIFFKKIRCKYRMFELKGSSEAIFLVVLILQLRKLKPRVMM